MKRSDDPEAEESRLQTVSAAFHLTHNCNLRCTYCYTGEKFGPGMTEETADQAVAFALDEARRAGARHLEVVFFGGEPLLRLDLVCRICDRARALAGGELRVSFKMSTNGVLLTPKAIAALRAREVYVSLSLDGDPAVQAVQRPDHRGRDVSAQLEGAIDRLLRWNPCAAVNCVVTPGSARVLDQSVSWIFRRGFSYVSVALDYSAAWTLDDLDALEAAYRRLGEWYVAQTRAGEKFYLSAFDDRIRSHARAPLEPQERCFLGGRQFSIAPSGRLYPCVSFVRDDRDEQFVIGDVWRGLDARQGAISSCAEGVKPECQGCRLLERCSSWCACINWQSTGHVDRASPVVCELERRLIPIADRVAARLWRKRDPNFIHKHYNPAFPVLSFVERVAIEELDRA